jgi:hypothetical protein
MARPKTTLALLKELATRYGLPGPGTTTIKCAYCPETDSLMWLSDEEKRQRLVRHNELRWRYGRNSPVRQLMPTWIISTDFQLDHVVPLSRGGVHEADNLVFACPSCNASKWNHALEDWVAARRTA